MNEKPLIILITRISSMANTPNEWESTWGFLPNHVMALVRQGEVGFVDLGSLESINLSDRMSQDEVWVIHGKQYQNIKLRNALNAVPWSEITREITLRIHRGGGRSVKNEDFQKGIEGLKLENLKALLRKAEDYSLSGGRAAANHPVIQFVNVIKNGRWGQYEEAIKQLHPFSLPPQLPHERLRHFKHSLVNIFSPLDIDLQGWTQSGFNLKYWLSIVDDYEQSTEKNLEVARKLLYGDAASPEAESVQQLVTDAVQLAQEKQKEEIDKKWRAVQALLPSRAASTTKRKDESEERELTKNRKLFEIVAEILKEIHDQKLERVKDQLDSNNPFQEWVVGLNEALKALCEALQAQETKQNT
ncbi:MAG: hypothetical protein DKINENOH_01715 [bacterium]|nr:hypothetical protein [bacterium]